MEIYLRQTQYFILFANLRPVPVSKERLRQWISGFLLEVTAVGFGCLVLGVRMRGTIIPFPYTPSYQGQKKILNFL
jgi:hypothetical protein